jgi:hypothetical protein
MIETKLNVVSGGGCAHELSGKPAAEENQKRLTRFSPEEEEVDF